MFGQDHAIRVREHQRPRLGNGCDEPAITALRISRLPPLHRGGALAQYVCLALLGYRPGNPVRPPEPAFGTGIGEDCLAESLPASA